MYYFIVPASVAFFHSLLAVFLYCIHFWCIQRLLVPVKLQTLGRQNSTLVTLY